MSMELASFVKSGLSAVTGSSEMARRLSVAVVAAGLSVPGVLAMSAAAPAWAAAKSAPARQAPAVQSTEAEAQTDLGPRDIADFREQMAPYAGAAVTHGLNPEAFVTAVALYHGFTNQDLEAESINLAPATGRKGEGIKVLDKDASRWVDLVRAHGRDSGAKLAVDTLDAAMSLEDGKRRKPVTEATVRRIVGMWNDPKLEAEILAREVAAVTKKLPKDTVLDAAQTYMVVAFGFPKLVAFSKALGEQLPENRHKAHPTGGGAHAFRVLDASSENNPLFFDDLGNGRVKPVNSLEFYGKVQQAAENLKELSHKAVEANSASLEEDVEYAGPRLG